jgi:hypothetical protein
LSQIAHNATQLRELYAGESRAVDADALAHDGAQVYSVFYERLRDVKESYRKHPRLVADPDAAIEETVNVTDSIERERQRKEKNSIFSF